MLSCKTFLGIIVKAHLFLDSVVVIMHVSKYGYESERLIIEAHIMNLSLTIISDRLVSCKGFKAP